MVVQCGSAVWGVCVGRVCGACVWVCVFGSSAVCLQRWVVQHRAELLDGDPIVLAFEVLHDEPAGRRR